MIGDGGVGGQDLFLVVLYPTRDSVALIYHDVLAGDADHAAEQTRLIYPDAQIQRVEGVASLEVA